MEKLEYSVLLLLEVSSLFEKNAISVERNLTLKEEDFALRKTKRVLNAEKLVILGVSAEAHHLKEWRLCFHKVT